MTDKNTYPELVELISKLQFESRYDDAKICVKALYDLSRQDKRISELEAQNERWGKAGLQCQAEWNMAQVRIDELEAENQKIMDRLRYAEIGNPLISSNLKVQSHD